MAKTLVVDQTGNRLGYMPGFRNFALAYVDDYGIPWLPIDGKSFHDVARALAVEKELTNQLRVEVETLRSQIDA